MELEILQRCDRFKPILHNVFQSSMHALTIRYNNLNVGVLFHYCTNFTFLCVVKNEQETDSLGLSGQNQDINFTGEKNRVAFNTWLFYIVYNLLVHKCL